MNLVVEKESCSMKVNKQIALKQTLILVSRIILSQNKYEMGYTYTPLNLQGG